MHTTVHVVVLFREERGRGREMERERERERQGGRGRQRERQPAWKDRTYVRGAAGVTVRQLESLVRPGRTQKTLTLNQPNPTVDPEP